MKQEEKNLPLSLVSLIFGGLSIPLAFAVHLCSLALVLGVLAFVFGRWGSFRSAKHLLRYSAMSTKRAVLGQRLGLVGSACATIMWVLWANNVFF